MWPAIAHRRFLFVLWDGAGAVTVEARLVSRLIARGHRVAVLGPRSIARHFAFAGCEFIVDPSAEPYDSATDYPEDELAWLRDRVWFGRAAEQAELVLRTATAWAANVVVCDWLLFAAMSGAEASGRPTAALWPGLYGIRVRPQDLPPGDPGKVFWESGLDELNTARRSVALTTLTSVFDQRDAMTRILVLTLPRLDDPGTALPANARYVGPSLEEPTFPGPGRQESTPVVLVSLSTGNMAQGPVLQRTVDALGELPVHGVVTVGPAIPVSTLALPANVTAHQHLPHAAVLPTTALVVCHAGHGTVVAALAYGVPLLCMPMGRDQFQVGARVVATGAGSVIDAQSTAIQIRQAVVAALANPDLRSRAAELMAAIQASTRADLAVHELEGLAALAPHRPRG